MKCNVMTVVVFQVALIRMTSDGNLPADQVRLLRFNYDLLYPSCRNFKHEKNLWSLKGSAFGHFLLTELNYLQLINHTGISMDSFWILYQLICSNNQRFNLQK
jgi:hypothetical protein